MIDTTFNVYSDANGGDPDRTSQILRSYSKFLKSKNQPCGKQFSLSDDKAGAYLYHNFEFGEYSLGSDAITHSYRNHKNNPWLTQQIQENILELFDSGSTIEAYTLFPNNRTEGKNTITQAQGVNSLINDRFNLTLECIRLFDLGRQSPFYDTILWFSLAM